MKVGELLSGPTLTSSRVLTAFSATILVVVLTGSDPTKLPLLSGLNISSSTVYWLLLGLLFFFAVVHVVNFANDYTAEEKNRLSVINDSHLHRQPMQSSTTAWLEGAHFVEPYEISRREAYYRPDFDANKHPAVASAIKTEAAEIRSRRLNYLVKFGLHIVVPVGLALCATAALAITLVAEAWT